VLVDFSDTTVVVPAKNEPAVRKVVDGVLSALPMCRVLVMYRDYDRDPLFRNSRVRMVHAVNGKGMLVQQVQRRHLVKTPIMCLIDADSTYEPRDLRALVRMVRNGHDMALGNRFAKRISAAAMPPRIQFGNKVITKVANLLYGLSLHDSQTGIRAIRTSAFESLDLHEPRFGIESEMNIKMARRGFRIGEAPASYYPRVGESKQTKGIDSVEHILIELKFLGYSPKDKHKSRKAF
jgi:hypothetical protein